MLTVEGIYDGEKVQFLEDIPFEGKKKVLITFLDHGTYKKGLETDIVKTPAQVLLELSGSWEDEREAGEIVSQIKKARKNSTKLTDGF